jgi:hypothetical protein
VEEGMMADQLVARVLGPVGPDAGCDGTLALLDELVELESTGRTAPESFAAVTRHLEACPDCREDYEGLRALARDDS